MVTQKIEKYIFLIPIIYSIIVVAIYGVNVLYWDEWATVRLYENIRKNDFRLLTAIQMLFSQHNEHRIFFPMVIMLTSRSLSYFNVKVDMFITQFFAILFYFYIIFYIKKQQDTKINNFNIKTIFIFLCGIACFTTIQYENFLWGFQVAFYMAIFCSVLSIFYLHQYILSENIKDCIISLLFGIIASFSSLHGILVWPVIIILLMLLLFTKYKMVIKYFFPYFITGIICYLIFFRNWNHPAYHPKLEYDIYMITKYIFGAIGGMYIGYYSKITVILGGITTILIIFLSLVFFMNRKFDKVIFPLGLIGYCYVSILSIAIGRVGFGVSQSEASRYMSFSILSYIGIVLLIYQYNSLADNKGRISLLIQYGKKLTLYILIPLSILLVYGNFTGLKAAKEKKMYFKENIIILQNYEKQSLDQLCRICPWPSYESAFADIEIIKRYRLNVFSKLIN